MQKEKRALNEALNLRIDAGLAAEIEWIAKGRGQTASEAARQLLSYGVEVERRLQAQRLSRNYDSPLDPDTAGRVVISAEFVPYTWAEATEISERLASGGHPKWDDLTP